MATKKRTSIPHHRVDRALFEQAKTVADTLGWSMSRVASWGLEGYLSDLSTEEYEALRRRAEEAGVPKDRKQALPVDVANQLAQLRQTDNDRLNAYMTALYVEGWSLRAIADAVGITRQSVYQRVRKFDGDPDVAGLVPVPVAPFIPAAPIREPSRDPSAEPVDWPLWVDRDLHLVASQRARDERVPMYEVMEGVLARFVEEFGD